MPLDSSNVSQLKGVGIDQENETTLTEAAVTNDTTSLAETSTDPVDDRCIQPHSMVGA